MSKATLIGRTGGLAVALGIGVAIVAAPGAAFADETGSSGDGASAASNSDRTERHAPRSRAARHSEKSADADVERTKPAWTVRDSRRSNAREGIEADVPPHESTPPRATHALTLRSVTGRSRPGVDDPPSAPAEPPLEAALAAWGTRPRTSPDTSVFPVATSSTAATPGRSGIAVVGQRVTLTGSLGGQAFTPDNGRVVVTATDDSSTLVTSVAVVNTATAAQVGPTKKLFGTTDHPPLLAAGGSRAVVTTHVGGDVSVAIVDTATGAQVGSTLAMSGDRQPTRLSRNGTRAVITTTSTDLRSGGTRLAVLDVIDGAQVGATVLLPGYQSATWSAEGNRALVTTIEDDGTAGITRLTVIDTDAGAQTGPTTTISGRLAGSPLFSADGSHVLVAADDGTNTHVAVLALGSGTPQVSSFVLSGGASWVGQTADGERALITARVDGTNGNAVSTSVALIDISTGAQIGTTLSVPGGGWGAPLLTDGTHALLVNYVPGSGTTLDTQVTVIDTSTGARTATPVILGGTLIQNPLLSADRTRALIGAGAGSVIIDTATGLQAGAAFPGRVVSGFEVAGADRTRAVITRPSGRGTPSSFDYTELSVIDSGTGTQIGNTLTLAGSPSAQPLASADGTRALIVTTVVRPIAVFGEPYSTRVTAVDTVTGKQVGRTLTLPGAVEGVQRMAADGNRVLVTTAPLKAGTTKLAVIDINTARVGDSVTLSGTYALGPLFGADGSRAVLATETYARRSGTVTSRITILRIT